MIKSPLWYIVLCLFLTSCFSKDERKIIHYEYKGVYLTRVNDYPKDFFYYGKFDNLENLPKQYIISTFSGFDGLMDAYIIFKEDQTIEIRPVAEEFIAIGKTTDLYLNDRIENIDFIRWTDNTKNNLDSILRVRDVIDLERTINLSGASKVKAVYNIKPFK